jgi:lipopolysaccharide assembly protein A
MFVVLAAAGLALFAVANRAPVAIGLWPAPFLLEAPLYLVVLLALLVGLLTGALIAWVGGWPRRRELRRQRRRIAALERELSATQAQFAAPAGSGSAALSAGA